MVFLFSSVKLFFFFLSRGFLSGGFAAVHFSYGPTLLGAGLDYVRLQYCRALFIFRGPDPVFQGPPLYFLAVLRSPRAAF